MSYLMAFWCLFSMGNLRMLLLLSLFMGYSCMAPFTLVVMVMRGLTFWSLFCKVSTSGSYLVCSCSMVSFK